MAVYHVKTTGSKTTGASTANDWSDANCYASLHAITFNANPGNNLTNGDEIIFDSRPAAADAIVHATSNARMAQVTGSGTLTLKSRYGVAAGCVLDGTSASTSDVNMNCPGVMNLVFQDITFSKTTTHTATNLPNLYINAETANVTFTRCRFANYSLGQAQANNTLSSLCVSRLNGATTTSRTVTFTDCEWSGISGTLTGAAGGGFKPLFFGHSGTTLTFTGTNTITGVDLTLSGNNSAAAQEGYFAVSGTATINVNGPMSVSDCSVAVTNTDAVNSAVIKTISGATLNVNYDIEFENITHSGGLSHAFGVHVTGPYTISASLIATDCATAPATDGLGLGGVFCSDDTAAGIVEYIEATRVNCNNGVIAETTGGGAMILNGFKAIDCKTQSGVLYLGGDGDAHVKGGLIKGTRQLGSPVQTTMDIFVQTNETTVDRDCVRNISNVTILDSDPLAGLESVFVRHVNTGATNYVQTTTFRNCLFLGGCETQMKMNEGSATTLNLTLVKCGYLAAGDINSTGHGGGSGTFTNTTPIVDAGLASEVDENGYILPGSQLINAGVASPGGHLDAYRRRFRNPPSVGGVEYRSRVRTAASRNRATRVSVASRPSAARISAS